MAKIDDIVTITIKSATIPDFTITGFGDSDWKTTVVQERRLLNRVPCKNHVKNALKIKGKSFPDYLYHRMMKDNLGFVPTDDIWAGQTDCKSYIVAMAPQKQHEFLVYAHELGHCKSKQYENTASSFWGVSTVDEYKLKNEYNAWVWALKYYRRLGFQLCKESKALVKTAFMSYISSASNVEMVAEELANSLDKQFDIGINFKPLKFGDLKIKTLDYEVKEKPKGWKPWHDLKQKQMKKSWKYN